MLETLRRIIQEFSAKEDLAEALQVMVERVREAVDTQAAAIYLIDNSRGEYVLMAADGLNPEAIGKIRLPFNEGLIGWVGRREEPINLEDAPSHPRFFYHAGVGEEKYRAFLGVPIIHQRRLFGVLTVQQEDQRRYDEHEEAFLVTISAQLSSVIAHADSTGLLLKLTPLIPVANKIEEAAFGGIPGVRGVGIGQAVIVYPMADLDAVPKRRTDDIDGEIALFEIALTAARSEIENLSERMKMVLPPEEHAIFEVYKGILGSDNLGNEVVARIQTGQWAQGALRSVIKNHINHFEAMDDPYLRERASDFRDLGRRVLSHLQSSETAQIDYPDQTILVGEEVTASALAEVPEGCLRGIVSGKGSSNSHTAILARALGVPTVMGAKGMSVDTMSDLQLIVDGYFGQVYISPSPSLLKEFEGLAEEEKALDDSLESLRDQPSQTPDGHHIKLCVNVGLAADASMSLSVGAEGVGLYRSEVSFMTRDRFPVEEEQRVIYRQLLKAFAPRPVVMRTLDVGGDKTLPYFPIVEDNPFLGWRGIRITLDHPDVFLLQVRAMLRANIGLNNLQILLPMVSGVGEVDEALHLIEQAYQEVREEEADIEWPRIGVMIEIPSAVYQARDIAKRVHFLSVGSNDLTQYMLAVDRTNSRVAGLYDSLHPAMLKALMQVVEGAHSEGRQVSICGEMASDPVAAVLLLAMGFDMLSMNSKSLLRMKWVIRSFSLTQARMLLSEVLEMDNATLIRFRLEKAIDAAGLGGLIRAGK